MVKLGLKKSKNLTWFFILKPRITSIFISDRQFMSSIVFLKNWQQIRFSKLAKFKCLMIYQTLCLLSLMKSHSLFVASAVKKGFQNPKVKKLRGFFFFEVRYLLNRCSDFVVVFCKVLKISFYFHVKNKCFEKFRKFKKIEISMG